MCCKLTTLLNVLVVLILVDITVCFVYPEPDYNGTSSVENSEEWGQWGHWNARGGDRGSCGHPDATGYVQTRYRTRGWETQSERKFRYVCQKVTGVYINLPDLYHAGTTADLWMGIQQGMGNQLFGTQCTTKVPTWDAPDDGPGPYWRGGDNGCKNTFDVTRRLTLYLYSDSWNDVYVTYMGARIGLVYKTWYAQWIDLKVQHPKAEFEGYIPITKGGLQNGPYFTYHDRVD